MNSAQKFDLRSSLSTRRTLCTSSWLSKGDLQNVQGPSPSFTHMTLPQFKQLGAMSSSGCRVAIQLHFRRRSSSALEAKEGLVCTSRLRMAESRSDNAVEAPCMAVPPDMLIFVFGAGEEFREDCEVPFEACFLGESESDTRGPEADGGCFAVIGRLESFALSVINGIWVASGRSCRRAKLSATWSLCLCREGAAR